jgi:hypothetical protein
MRRSRGNLEAAPAVVPNRGPSAALRWSLAELGPDPPVGLPARSTSRGGATPALEWRSARVERIESDRSSNLTHA